MKSVQKLEAAHFRKFFDTYSDRGVISTHRLPIILIHFGPVVNKERVGKLLESALGSEPSTISFDQFLRVMTVYRKEIENEKLKLSTALYHFVSKSKRTTDRIKVGHISEEQLRHILEIQTGERNAEILSGEEVEEALDVLFPVSDYGDRGGRTFMGGTVFGQESSDISLGIKSVIDSLSMSDVSWPKHRSLPKTLTQRPSGSLRLRISSIRGLEEFGRMKLRGHHGVAFHSMDPLVCISIGEHTRRTTMIRDSFQPEWQSEIVLPIEPPSQSILEIQRWVESQRVYINVYDYQSSGIVPCTEWVAGTSLPLLPFLRSSILARNISVPLSPHGPYPVIEMSLHIRSSYTSSPLIELFQSPDEWWLLSETMKNHSDKFTLEMQLREGVLIERVMEESDMNGRGSGTAIPPTATTSSSSPPSPSSSSSLPPPSSSSVSTSVPTTASGGGGSGSGGNGGGEGPEATPSLSPSAPHSPPPAPAKKKFSFSASSHSNDHNSNTNNYKIKSKEVTQSEFHLYLTEFYSSLRRHAPRRDYRMIAVDEDNHFRLLPSFVGGLISRTRISHLPSTNACRMVANEIARLPRRALEIPNASHVLGYMNAQSDINRKKKMEYEAVGTDHPGYQICSPVSLFYRGYTSEQEAAITLCAGFIGLDIHAYVCIGTDHLDNERWWVVVYERSGTSSNRRPSGINNGITHNKSDKDTRENLLPSSMDTLAVWDALHGRVYRLRRSRTFLRGKLTDISPIRFQYVTSKQKSVCPFDRIHTIFNDSFLGYNVQEDDKIESINWNIWGGTRNWFPLGMDSFKPLPTEKTLFRHECGITPLFHIQYLQCYDKHNLMEAENINTIRLQQMYLAECGKGSLSLSLGSIDIHEHSLALSQGILKGLWERVQDHRKDTLFIPDTMFYKPLYETLRKVRLSVSSLSLSLSVCLSVCPPISLMSLSHLSL